MLDEIFLHIGMHKTGSSTIQLALEGYDDGATFYADLGSSNHSIALRTAFDPHPEQIEPHIARGRSADEVKQLRAKYLSSLEAQAARPGKRMVLSGEGVCDLADEGIPLMWNWLTAHAKKVTVFAYVREPVAFVNSYFAESVKHGLVAFDVPSPEYPRRLGRFRDVFSAGNVIFRLFDPRSFEGGSLLVDFCKIAELDRSQLSEEMRSNESLSFEAVQVLFALNRHTRDLPRDSAHVHTLRNVRKALMAGGQSKFRLCGEAVQASMRQEDITWFEEVTRQGFDTNKLLQNSEHCVRDLEDLLSLRPQTKNVLFGILRDRGIDMNEADPEKALAKLYNTFRAEVIGPRHKRMFKKILKKLGLS